MSEKNKDKVEIRLRIPKWHHDVLQEYCELYGTSQSAALCGYITDVCWMFLVKSPPRADILSKNINNRYSADCQKKAKSNSKPRKKKTTQISDDFAPPRSIAEGEGLDHSIAVAMFIDWAKGKGHTQADWNATFRNACRGWIKERMPRPEPKLKQL